MYLETDYSDVNIAETQLQTAFASFALVSKRAIIDRLSPNSFSPPTAALAQDGIDADLPTQTDGPGSPAFSTSSTAEGGSSPVLPSLPAPVISGRVLDLLKTPPQDPRSDSNRYYTASWGSPYPEPSNNTSGASVHNHQKTSSSEPFLDLDSPFRRLEFHTPYLRPAPNLDRSATDPTQVSAAVLANRARRPNRGLTEDWIRQHTSGDPELEKLAWLSESDESEHSSLSSSLSDGAEDDFDPAKTPTLRTFIERRNRIQGPSRARTNSVDTITPGDFQSTTTVANMASPESVDPLAGMNVEQRNGRKVHARNSSIAATALSFFQGVTGTASKISLDSVESLPSTAEEVNSIEIPSPVEKPLPAPPSDEKVWRAAAMPRPVPLSPEKTSKSPAPTPRLKKKVPWKGKNIMVLLPWDDERGQKGKAPTPMTNGDIEKMLQEWEALGYSTTGFNLGHSDPADATTECQSSRVWPYAMDVQEERHARNFRVSIPDRKLWDAYVQDLREAKLRALGVSLGDDDPPAVSPATSTLSRTNTMPYPPLPFSPPIPTSSANSSHVAQHQNPFSPVLLGAAGQSTSQSSNVGSIASPASMHVQMYGKYNPRASVSVASSEHPFGSPFQYPQQVPSPGAMWSPQQMLYQPSLARVGSPSTSNLSAIISPSSSFSQDGYFPQPDLAFQLQQRQQQLQNQAHLQIQARQSPRLQEIRPATEDDSKTERIQKSPSMTPDASQFIRHNPSNSLQKEIDDAEYHLEEQFERQLEQDDYSPHSDKVDGSESSLGQNIRDKSHARKDSGMPGGVGATRFANVGDGPELHHPQPHSRGHSLSQRPFVENDAAPLGFFGDSAKMDFSEGETNQSNTGTLVLSNEGGLSGQRTFSTASNPWLDSEPVPEAKEGKKEKSKRHKKTMSTLNVSAPEFKFNPASAFKPDQFSLGAPFQSAVSVKPILTLPSAAPVKLGASKINVAAPVFTPGNSEFSFSSSGPTFRPDAPAFTPMSSTMDTGSGTDGSSNPRTSIFGKIDLSLADMVKPAKKSKAIPIVRPDSGHSKNPGSPKDVEDDTVFDREGRITQGEGRVKRARGQANDGDSIPLFAEPTPEPEIQPNPPLQETSRDQSPPKEITLVKPSEDDKENTPVASKDGHLRVVSISAPAKALNRNSALQDSPDYDGKGWAPWEFRDQKHVEDFNAASAFPVKEPTFRIGGNASEDVQSPIDSSLDPSSAPPSATEPPKKHKKNSLSALAKPFDFTQSWFKFGSSDVSKPTPAPDPIEAQVPVPPLDPVPVHTPTPVIAAAVVKQNPTSTTTSISLPSAGLANSRYATSPPFPAEPVHNSSVSPIISLAEKSSAHGALPQPQSPPPYVDEVEPQQEPEVPSFEEIDAVMRQLNKEPALGASRDTDTPRWHQPSPNRRIQIPVVNEFSPIRLQPENLLRSDAPSPSPRRFQALPGDPSSQRVFSRAHDDPFMDDSRIGVAFDSPVHRLNRGNTSASDWDDVVSEADEGKFQARSQFFDGHVNELVGGLLAEKLDPLERVLETIQLSIANISARSTSRRDRRSVSGELPESDADDEEEDEDTQRRSLSPRRDRKMEKIRSIITDALAAHQITQPTQVAVEPKSIEGEDVNILQALEDMKEQFGQSMRLDLRGEDLRNIVEEAVERRMPATPKPDETSNAKISDLEARIKELVLLSQHAEQKAEQEIDKRRAAEDRLAENQRLLRISSEEEHRLRETLEEKERKLKTIEDARSKTLMRTTLLEASSENAQKSQSEFSNKISVLEIDLRQARQQAQHWQSELEKALDSAKRHNDDAEHANQANTSMRKTIEGLKVQMEETLHIRESMRVKLGNLQEDMAKAAREISQENAGRAKKEQQLVARQEVLDARLQAEARTRERLEREIERLESGEREGMRAVNESRRLETLLSGLRNELHEAQKTSLRHQREFEEARESGLSEVQRTRHYMQAEIDTANNQVNIVRQDLEDQVARIRADFDHVKLDADTAKEKFEMLLEEVTDSKRKEIDMLVQKHENEIEDLQTQHERQIGNTLEQAQGSEQLLLERLSLSASKTDHLQDRVTHLEERLEIAKTAAQAAVQAARSTSASAGTKPVPRSMELPEKISPQALRESIMVLQEQLQEREQTIEALEAKLSTVDLDAPTKISKRDDEITWLRELLAVRKGDLEDLIAATSSEDFDFLSVKDAAIRLKANLQMEEQERERAFSGSGLYALPNIAASLKDAATPRVQQVVGPMAAAWGNWRKSQETDNTPSKASPQSFLSGLLTPPASARTPLQPVTASGRRFTAQQLANRPRGSSPKVPARDRNKGKARADGSTFSTPPMLRRASYDRDAEVREFSDTGFYDDDESTVDDSMFGAGRL